jgi:phenylalanyl-tRNA synthetase alpha subunit
MKLRKKNLRLNECLKSLDKLYISAMKRTKEKERKKMTNDKTSMSARIDEISKQIESLLTNLQNELEADEYFPLAEKIYDLNIKNSQELLQIQILIKSPIEE